MKKEKQFYIDFDHISTVFPSRISEKVSNFGPLSIHQDELYTLEQINEIIAKLIVKTPYIPGYMDITLIVMNKHGYHHILTFKNYDYAKQKKSETKSIEFLY